MDDLEERMARHVLFAYVEGADSDDDEADLLVEAFQRFVARAPWPDAVPSVVDQVGEPDPSLGPARTAPAAGPGAARVGYPSITLGDRRELQVRLASATVSHPLREDADGIIRIGGTRVTLQTVIAAYDDGAGPEEIALQYPALTLEQVYATISYFLGHEADLREYIDEERAASADERRSTEARPEIARLRERLLARRKTT
jgi:uncharacterized protein (DUF433 family)